MEGVTKALEQTVRHPLPKKTPPAHGPMACRACTNEKELALLDQPNTSRSSVCPT